MVCHPRRRDARRHGARRHRNPGRQSRDNCDATYWLLSAREGRCTAAAADPLRGAAAVGPDWLGAGHGRAPAQDRSPLLKTKITPEFAQAFWLSTVPASRWQIRLIG